MKKIWLSDNKFNLGDKIFITKTSVKADKVIDCKYCDGTGDISFYGKIIPCPNCNGVGRTRNTKTIKEVDLNICFVTGVDALYDEVEDEWSFRYSVSVKREKEYFKHKVFEEYESYIAEDEIFTTKEVAQDFCNKKNNK